MSLVKKPRMTERKRAADRRNQKLSHGPKTAQGRANIRDTHLRHGFYSKSEEDALRALGENPEDFREVLQGLRDSRTAAASLEARLGERMARALWRMERADRMQEGHALRLARQQEAGREGRVHMQMMRLKMVSGNWQLLAERVARPRYLTTRQDLELMHHLHKEGVAGEMSEVALALFYQLREPGLAPPGDPAFEDQEEEAKRRRVMNKIRGIFGLDALPHEPTKRIPRARPGPCEDEDDGGGLPVGRAAAGENPAPDCDPSGSEEDAGISEADTNPAITEVQWEKREPVRQLLENLLRRQVQLFDDQHRALMREVLQGPSPQERAAEVTPTHSNSPILQRMEDSNLRQFARMANLYVKVKRLNMKMELE